MAGKVNYGDMESSLKEESNTTLFRWLTLPYGQTKFMVCPPKDEAAPWFVEVGVHYGFIDSEGKGRAYKCSKEKYGRCPICDRVKSLKLKGNLNEARDISVSTFFLFNVVHIHGDDDLFTLKVLSAMKSQKNEILSLCYAYNKDRGVDPADLHNKKVFRGNRTKTDPWFSGLFLKEQADISDEEVERILGNLYDLTKAYVDYSPEQLERMLAGENINKVEDLELKEEVVEEKPKAKVKKEEAVEELELKEEIVEELELKEEVVEEKPKAKVKKEEAVELKEEVVEEKPKAKEEKVEGNKRLSVEEIMAKLSE